MDIYNDIAARTNGDIYIGVVGPVRTGKSTFVTRFMESLVLPKIKNKNVRQRAIDELPQSADGKTIMTTQPKFVPNEAVKITLGDGIEANVRLIDCVGYLVEGAQGAVEQDKPRLVKTPWSNDEMPFEQAATIGTQKVVRDHSTIAVVITNDGSITEIPRVNYVSAEERVIEELQELNKPFAVVLNTTKPTSTEVIELAQKMEKAYNVAVLPVDVKNMDSKDINKILLSILREFDVKKVEVDISQYLKALPVTNHYITQIISGVKNGCACLNKMKDFECMLSAFDENEDFNKLELNAMVMADGTVKYKLDAKPELFFKVLSQEAKTEINDDITLMKYVTDVATNKAKYDKINDALATCEATGYGIVMPSVSDMSLMAPEIAKQGNKYGVKLKASAPSLHIMKVDVEAEVHPIMGTEQQGQYLLSEFQNNPETIWQTNMFGKSMSQLVQDGLSTKLMVMPREVQEKIRKTVCRVVNDNKGGLICILL